MFFKCIFMINYFKEFQLNCAFKKIKYLNIKWK